MSQEQLCSLIELGDRLRVERKRLGLRQGDLGGRVGITLQTQSRYENGTTEAGVLYLAKVSAEGIDAGWVLTGRRSGSDLSADQSSLLDAFNDLGPTDRAVLQRLAASLAGRPAPAALVALPSTGALTAAFQAFLKATPGMDEDELVHELATQLPTILRAAEDELPAEASALSDEESAAPPAAEPASRASRQARRS
jgi:transcriptional regulator with XRE-family HTH domain